MQIHAYSFITAVKAVLPFAGVRDVRYYLNGVHIFSTPDGLIVEATDGHTAARVTLDGEYGDTRIIIDRSTATAISRLKVAKAERDSAYLTWTGSGGITFGDVTVDAEPIVGGPYPDLGRVLVKPGPSAAPLHGVNSAYMERAFKCASLLAHPRYHGTRLYVGGEHDRLYVEAGTNHGTFAAITKPAMFVVMSMRL